MRPRGPAPRASLAAALLWAGACGSGQRVTAPPQPSATPPPATGHWTPRAGLTWQWQLSGAIDTSKPAAVYDIDWEADAAVVAALHAVGRKVICYVSVGSWEDWRPDAGQFPPPTLGAAYPGWPGERYLDIRAAAVRAVMERRFDACKQKGFDAIEPDNMDVFEVGAASGFPLTEADGVDFALWLADAAHARGLGIGQKNAASITAAIQARYDWALTESCYADGNWCPQLAPYLGADKPVFMCEYQAASFAQACAWAAPRRYSPILKALDLGAPVTTCP